MGRAKEIQEAQTAVMDGKCPVEVKPELKPVMELGKFLVECLMLNALFAGVSPAPKQGPQNAVLSTAPPLNCGDQRQ